MAIKNRPRRLAAATGVQALTLNGQEFVVVQREDYEQLRAAAGLRDADLPPLPKPDKAGNVPALAYSRVSLARKLIVARKSAGFTQAELAAAAGVRVETINRLENGRNMPDLMTITKIESALGRAIG